MAALSSEAAAFDTSGLGGHVRMATHRSLRCAAATSFGAASMPHLRTPAQVSMLGVALPRAPLLATNECAKGIDAQNER